MLFYAALLILFRGVALAVFLVLFFGAILMLLGVDGPRCLFRTLASGYDLQSLS